MAWYSSFIILHEMVLFCVRIWHVEVDAMHNLMDVEFFCLLCMKLLIGALFHNFHISLKLRKSFEGKEKMIIKSFHLIKSNCLPFTSRNLLYRILLARVSAMFKFPSTFSACSACRTIFIQHSLNIQLNVLNSYLL